MPASRTLDRKRTKDRVILDGQVVYADRAERPRRMARGTPFRNVATLRHPTPAAPYEVSFHATKGLRVVRVSV